MIMRNFSIPEYGIKITVDNHKDCELEILNTHYQAQSMQFAKIKPDGSTRNIQPGKIYLIDDGDKFTYLNTDVIFEVKYKLEEEKNQNDNKGDRIEQKNNPSDNSKISSLDSLIKLSPKKNAGEQSLFAKPKDQSPEDNVDSDVFEAPTQVKPGILKKGKVNKPEPKEERKDEETEEEDSKANLEDIINQPTLIIPKKNLDRKEKAPKKSVGFVEEEKKEESKWIIFIYFI